MDQFLKLAWLPLAVAVLVTVLFNWLTGAPWYDVAGMGAVGVGIVGVCIGLALLSFWHHGWREKCPVCQSTNPSLMREKEIDRFVGSKQVNGTDGQGRTTTHHVSTTFAKIECHYTCSSAACRHAFKRVRKREVI
jgi:hypothetical protein